MVCTGTALADLGEVIAALPLAGERAEDAVQAGLLRGSVGDGEGFAAGLLQEFAVAEGIRDVKTKSTGLTGAEKLAGSAKLEVGFGNFKTI